MRRATSEIYYDLVKREPDFSQNFGPAVQSLIGEIAYASNRTGRFVVTPEVSYGPKNKRKDTIDWIIEDDTAVLFVECKSARVRYRGISDLTDQAFLDAEFQRIRSFTLQTYKTLASALRGEYPHWKPDGRPIFPLIVTLEDWQTFGIHIRDLVIDPLKQELESIGIDPEIVDKHPPSFCAIDTFDMAVNVCNIAGILRVFEQKTAGEYPQWALETFLLSHFGEELGARKESPFSDQWLKLMRDR